MYHRPVDNDTPPKLFNEPLISVTFDDGWESVYQTAAPQLQKYGIHTTQYVLSGNGNYPGYMSIDQIKSLQKSGHEIACHSIDHPDLTTLDNEDLSKQLNGCKTDLSKALGAPVNDFASPYGSYNPRTIAATKKVFSSHRNILGTISDGVDDYDVNEAATFDKDNIIGVTVKRDTTVAELQQLVDYARSHNAWLVLVYHQADDGPSQYGMDPTALDKQLAYLSKTPVRIVTVGQVIKTLR
jgi:peptidoglycan/xylan/chitin deacetylase (PgdA/CDA1 family)